MMSEHRRVSTGLNRRAFLGVTAGLTAGSACSAPTTPEGSSPERETAPEDAFFHVHGRRPLTKETVRGMAGASVVTPNSRFFVRNNLPMPSDDIVRDPSAWRLEVRGVRVESTLSVAELQAMGMQSISTVLQCSGNGRKFFEHGPSGSPWGVGAAGCAIWVGLPLSVLTHALGGVVDAAGFLTSTGGELLPQGVDRDEVVVERSIPIDKALDDCLLAWEMNGEPLPLEHGGPLRLIVPGYFGCNNIKYVKRLAFTEAQTNAKIQRSGYRLRPIGAKGAPDQPSMWQMDVKSWINGPGADGTPVRAGETTFHGVAFSGGHGVDRVEWSLDHGATWSEAKLIGPDLGRYAWRQFTFTVDLAQGVHRLVSRAHDGQGSIQPESRRENERGYGNNSWSDHGLTVTAAAGVSAAAPVPARHDERVARVESAAPPLELDAQAERGRAAVLSEAQPPCGACHTLADARLKGAVGPNLDELRPTAKRVEAAVTNGVGAMPGYEGRLSNDTIADIAHYVEVATGAKK